jgi:UDP-glucose 4-epimerase
MVVLITGGAGFIGSHLAEKLVLRGDSILILDDLSTGSVDNIRKVESSGRVKWWIDTVTNEQFVDQLVEQADIVYHLAAAVGVRLIVDRPVHTLETNVRGTEVVLKAALKHKKPVFIASTSEVYGKSKQIPFSETADLVMGPTSKSRWGYAASKAMDEFLALAYWQEEQLPVVIGRFFNTVGPRQTGRYGMVLPNFVSQAIANQPITVFGTGKQSRCFCFVEDVVDAITRLMDNTASVGQVFNIGSNVEITMDDLAHRVKHLAGSTSDIIHVPYETAYGSGFEDMLRRVPDISKIARHIGWQPKTGLDDIVRSVVRHHRNLGVAPAYRASIQQHPTYSIAAAEGD